MMNNEWKKSRVTKKITSVKYCRKWKTGKDQIFFIRKNGGEERERDMRGKK